MLCLEGKNGRRLALLFLALGIAGDICGVASLRNAAVRAEQRRDQRLLELRRHEETSPAPTEENVRAIEADLERAGRALAALREHLQEGRNLPATLDRDPPASRADAFFDLADFVERTREHARRSGVAVKPDERFGFSSYAAEGPAAELVPAVFRQRCAVQYIVHELIEAHPHHLVLVQREVPTTSSAATKGGRERPGPNPQERLALDFFAVDPRLSLRAPGSVEAMGFRLGFVGSTANLRDFLNRLAAGEAPAAVRAVEVEPANPADSMSDGFTRFSPNTVEGKSGAAEETAAAPIAAPALLKFIVTVEMIAAAGEGAEAAPEGREAGSM
ncbi:MAG TPA: Amuc_1100 family pilus-like protein [Opitutaceae bacterium]|nr:Amuc_1100 family pilus-like protein [Opitutaceae bacterium]